MHPFLDASKLTDEELIERLGKAYTIMNYQISMGHTPTVESIKEVIKTLEDEKSSRMQKIQQGEAEKKTKSASSGLEIGKLED